MLDAILPDYFTTLSENTLLHLAIVAGGIAIYFVIRVSYHYHVIRKSRKAIPLVIGGWGTRGKSGTERIKAALFHALGCELIVKTTGNEAMFIHSVPEQKPMELFIFRPYDRATIWEQERIVKLGADLNVQVMMWECMALNPRYVGILQRVWMRDDIATITNTHPDHEDVQGPAGFNIPQVMTNFIPKGRPCFTAEEQMLPILQEGAREQGANLQAISWRDVEFLTEDVLDRFPYKEHPANIALVLMLAEHLGIEKDFALKEMADNVVPDIGVLKTYPVADYLGRRLEFTLGNSANERLGFMNNWHRAGFDEHHNAQDADVWITTCVNNRADRIPRSKVFADMMVMDICVHKHFVIGTNLTGLYGYIQKALSHRLEDLFLIYPDDTRDVGETPLDAHVQESLRKLLDEFKVEASTIDDVLRKLQKMLEGVGLPDPIVESILNEPDLRQVIEDSHANSPEIEVIKPIVKAEPAIVDLLARIRGQLIDASLEEDIADAIVEFFEKYIRTYHSVSNFKAYIQEKVNALMPSGEALHEINEKAREFAKKIFNDKLEIIMDSAATGDQIIDTIARCSPPGHTIRIMGAQNIKGTGLDFAYRWISLDRIMQRIPLLEAKDDKTRIESIQWFAYYKEYGIIDCKPAIEALSQASKLSINQSAGIQQQISSAIRYVESEYEKKLEQLSDVGGHGFLSHVCSVLEQVVDTRDSRRRRKLADSVLKDLVHERISHEQAAIVLRDLTKRQKGGWLERDMRNFFKKTGHILTRRQPETPA